MRKQNKGKLEILKLSARVEESGKIVFALMPLDDEYEDLYIYGIRGATEKTGFFCLRADEIEHNSEILEEILNQIDRSSVIIAEITDKNPNVYYEVGICFES